MRVLLVMLLASLAVATPALAKPGQVVTFEAPRDLLDPSAREASLAELDGLGVRALRIVLLWRDVAPSPAARIRPAFDAADASAYDWSRIDPVLDAAKDRGWQVLVTISGPVPRWATEGARDHVTRPSPNEFRRFVTAVAEHLGDRVTWWSIWNEPNHPQFLKPQYGPGKRPLSPKVYRGLYAAALRGLANAGDTKPVYAAETAPVGTRKDVAPLTFLREMLCLNRRYRKVGACGRLRIDGWAHHAYTRRAGPFYVPDGPNDVTIGSLSRLVRALDRAATAGVVRRGLPVHLTEFGIQSLPDPFYGVPQQQQEEFRAISERIAWDHRRVASFSQYLLRDDNPVPGVPRLARYGGFESGLRTSAGKAKLALEGFRLPVAARRTSTSVSLWGLVRPGSGERTVTIEVADGSGAWRPLATVVTGDAGHWTRTAQWKSGRRWRATWTAPDGTVYAGAPTRAYTRRGTRG